MKKLLEYTGNLFIFVSFALIVFILSLATADEVFPLTVTSAVFCAMGVGFYFLSKGWK